jgi:hypothetical protein
MMRLALLLDRRYAPYQKWLGTAFAQSRHPDDLPTHLAGAVHAPNIAARESALASAYAALARRHNGAGLTSALDPAPRTYHDRAAQVLMADRFTDACLATIDDPVLKALPLIGAIDQVIDNTDVLSEPERYRQLASLYDGSVRSPSQ